MLRKVGLVALGIALPAGVCVGWVLLYYHAGFALVGPPTPEQARWETIGLVAAAMGYLLIAVLAATLWKRSPFFARPAAIVGATAFLIQLGDFLY